MLYSIFLVESIKKFKKYNNHIRTTLGLLDKGRQEKDHKDVELYENFVFSNKKIIWFQHEILKRYLLTSVRNYQQVSVIRGQD